jgi:hypothetical protein
MIALIASLFCSRADRIILRLCAPSIRSSPIIQIAT